MSELVPWADCRPLTCSVLPVRLACNCECPFCFSRSSLSALAHDRLDWRAVDLGAHFRWARDRGATRAVITGGGEPLLRPDDVALLVREARAVFDEVTCFTNGSRLTRSLATALRDAGLTYLCWSRHHHDDAVNRSLMGDDAPDADAVLAACDGLPVRATCVMAKGYIDDPGDVTDYVAAMRARGVREFTFKHTYVAHERSLFRRGTHDRWASEHRVTLDAFESVGEVIGRLPWGPTIRRIDEAQLCFYHEPTPLWERTHGICRSTNLLSDGSVYASLEDTSSLLYRLS